MSVLKRLAHALDRRDDVPNQELARELAGVKDTHGIREIAENLWNKDRRIRNDCIKVLYEIGYLDPSLIASYAGDFVKLLRSRDNRMVWGAMIALGTVAGMAAGELYPQVDEIKTAMEDGSVITKDAGVITLAGIASHDPAYNRDIFPYLLEHLRTCRSKDVPQHSEKAVLAVNAGNKQAFIAVLKQRLEDLQGAQVKRVEKVIRKAEQG